MHHGLVSLASGSNTHNNGDPAGDGQAGDAGEGLTGWYMAQTQRISPCRIRVTLALVPDVKKE